MSTKRKSAKKATSKKKTKKAAKRKAAASLAAATAPFGVNRQNRMLVYDYDQDAKFFRIHMDVPLGRVSQVNPNSAIASDVATVESGVRDIPNRGRDPRLTGTERAALRRLVPLADPGAIRLIGAL